MRTAEPTLAKLTRPRLYDAIPRERLFTILDDKRQHAVIWVAGPPGAGKTTLVASWLESRKLEGIWYQLDAGDADPATFYSYLGQVGNWLAGKSSSPLPSLTPEYLSDLPAFTRRYFRELFARAGRSVVVLDNFQDVPESSVFHDVIAGALSEIPQFFNVVVISRTTPSPKLARLRANRTIGTLGWDQLKLRLEESLSMARAAGNHDEAAATALQRVSDGWAAGLVLLLEGSESGSGEFLPPDTTSREKVFDYFAGEILDRASAQHSELLMYTAFLPRMTVPMAVAVTGRESAGELLHHCYKRHLFTNRRGGEDETYEYHALFREFLCRRARKTLDSCELHRILIRSAALLEASGHPDAAFALYCEATDWATACALLRREAPKMLQQGRGQTLREWVERFPAPTRERDPWIDYWYGTSLVPLDQPAARSALEPVFDRFTQAGDIAGKALSAAGITETYHFEWSRFRPLDRWITVLDEALQLGTKFSALESELRVCAAFLIAAARREPWHPSLPSRLARVLELLEEPLDPDQRVAAGTIVMSYCVHVADHDTACRAISIISPLLDEPSITAMNRIFWYTRLMTVLLRLRVSDEEASIAASKALTLAKEHNLKHVMPWVYYGQHELLAFKSNVSLLVANAQLIESNLVATRLVDQFLWRVVWVYIELTRGDAGAAHKHAEIAIQLADETGAVLLQGFARKHMAFAYVHAGNWIQAAGCIEEGRRILGSALFPYVTVQYDLLEAYIALRSNGAQHARDLLRGALASPVIFGVAKELLLCGPTVLQVLCVEALAADIESDTVKGLIRAFWLMPPVRHCHEWPWRIEIQALGPLQITQDGVALSRKGRSPTRLLQLLKLLLSSGGQPLSSSMVACELWPELEGDAAERNLDTVLHRLRRLLNCDDAIVLEDGKVRLDWRYCWVDAWAFADLAEGCLGLSPPDVVVRAKCALELYRGHFLEQDAEYPYAIGYRDRLRHLFARLVELAGGVLEQAGALSDANELYRRALALDPLTESIYRRLMLNLQKRGEATAALQVYRRCCEALSSGLGISPSLQTQSIASSLKRSDQPAL